MGRRVFVLLLLLCAAKAEQSSVAVPDVLPDPLVPSTRSERFPSREERLRLYLSNWYIPPCKNYTDGVVHYQLMTQGKSEHPSLIVNERRDLNAYHSLHVESIIGPDKLFFLDEPTLQSCVEATDENSTEVLERVIFPKNMRMYCTDVASSVRSAHEAIQWESPNARLAPLLFQFGDLKHSHDYGLVNLPHFKKFRSAAASPSDLDRVTLHTTCYDHARLALPTSHSTTHLQPIIWKLATNRHFRLVHKVYREDTAWSRKKKVAVFRGQLTGAELYDKHADAVTNCHSILRCRLVYQHARSKLVHARLTSTRERFPAVLKGRKLLGRKVNMRSLLQCKALIMLEGNDVASGLKWALLSQSVVLMPVPSHTSWAMEELLIPWVHYIPLTDNLTDVEDKMRWVVDHDDEARAIAQRSSLWMEDLVFHPDALEDDVWIQREMMKRYQTHFTAKKAL